MRLVLCLLACVLMPVPAVAWSVPTVTLQTVADVKNPGAIVFTPSLDHALVDSYELDILRPDGTALQTLNIGKPAVVAGECTAPLNVQPVTFGVGYSLRLRAVAGGAFSDYTVSVNKFDRVPGGPSKLIVK